MKAPPRRLALPLALAGVVLLLWDTFVVYPFRLFVVFLHEISHGLAAVVTGGSVVSIGLSFDEGGVCVTRGGWPFLILNAGYLGSLLWGALFLLLGGRRTRARAAIAVVGAFTLAVTLVYVRTLFGFFYGLLTAFLLLTVATKLKPGRLRDPPRGHRGDERPLRGLGRRLRRAPPPLRPERCRCPRATDRRARDRVGRRVDRALYGGAGLRPPAPRLTHTPPRPPSSLLDAAAERVVVCPHAGADRLSCWP